MEYIDIHTHPFKEYYDDPHEEVKKWICNIYLLMELQKKIALNF